MTLGVADPVTVCRSPNRALKRRRKPARSLGLPGSNPHWAILKLFSSLLWLSIHANWFVCFYTQKTAIWKQGVLCGSAVREPNLWSWEHETDQMISATPNQIFSLPKDEDEEILPLFLYSNVMENLLKMTGNEMLAGTEFISRFICLGVDMLSDCLLCSSPWSIPSPMWDLHMALPAAVLPFYTHEFKREPGELFACVFVCCVYWGREWKGRGKQ